MVSWDIYAWLVVFVCALCLTPVVGLLRFYINICLVSSYFIVHQVESLVQVVLQRRMSSR